MSPEKFSAKDFRAEAERKARADLAVGMELLKRVMDVSNTMEREAMCASAYKRLAMIEIAASRPAAAREALLEMHQHYAEAEKLGRERKVSNLFYPGLNLLGAELVLNSGQKGWPGLNPDVKAATRANLVEVTRTNPDFWSIVGLVELRMYEALEAGALAEALSSIMDDYDDAHRRVSLDWDWSSVYDQARLVLTGYADRAVDAERSAAQAIVKKLETFAAGTARS